MCLLSSKSIGLLYKEKEVIHLLVIVQSYIWARSEMKDKRGTFYAVPRREEREQKREGETIKKEKGEQGHCRKVTST